jgi:hypothetical protein
LSVDGTPAAADPTPASHYIAGFLAAAAVFAGFIAIVYYPGRLGAAAILVSLIAVAMGGFQSRLAAWAVALTTACWVAGMLVSIVFERPVF